MPYDPRLAGRVRELASPAPGAPVQEQRMFGGLDGVGPLVSGGRVGQLGVVDPHLLADDDALAGWIERGAAVAASLPPKRRTGD